MTRATPDCLELLEGLLKLNPNDRLRNVFRISTTVRRHSIFSVFRLGPAASGPYDIDGVLFRVTKARVWKLGSPCTTKMYR